MTILARPIPTADAIDAALAVPHGSTRPGRVPVWRLSDAHRRRLEIDFKALNLVDRSGKEGVRTVRLTVETAHFVRLLLKGGYWQMPNAVMPECLYGKAADRREQRYTKIFETTREKLLGIGLVLVKCPPPPGYSGPSAVALGTFAARVGEAPIAFVPASLHERAGGGA